ncbi:hypothetical protein J1N35_040753 [Gossypium stocksii]|uniref:Uncharacterized protein n=1 Tax=Gossypium stocksii TaxID=47602 RepID=A0A9D3ZI06_9ROSI|nr:hypothetical protein J1N35_040753 [Gossypium stocksii]
MLIRGNKASFPWREDLSVQEYSYNTDVVALRWQASMLEVVRPSNAQLPQASSLCSSLQFLLSEVNSVGLRCEKAHSKELIDLKAELVRVKGLEREVATEKESKEALRVDLVALEGLDMNSRSFDGLCPSSVIWDSFVSTCRGSLDFYIEEDPSSDKSVVPSTVNNDVTPYDDVCRGVDRDNIP